MLHLSKPSLGMAIVLAWTLLLVGCASVPLAPASQDQASKSFQPPAERAGLYIYRNERLGAVSRLALAVDGVEIGESASDTYFYLEVAPGLHTVTGEAENTSRVYFMARPGQLYYVWQEMKVGILRVRNRLHVVDARQGQAGVRECRLAQRQTPAP